MDHYIWVHLTEHIMSSSYSLWRYTCKYERTDTATKYNDPLLKQVLDVGQYFNRIITIPYHWENSRSVCKYVSYHYCLCQFKNISVRFHDVIWVQLKSKELPYITVVTDRNVKCHVTRCKKKQDMRVINDPLGHTHSTVPPVEITILTWNLFCFARFDNWRRTDTTCKNSDRYQLWLWADLVYQK